MAQALRRWTALVAVTLLAALAAPATSARADALADAARAYAAGRYPRAAADLRLRAERGDARAETFLGMLYLRGQGVPQSYDAAADWLRRGARQNEPVAQYVLGLLYDRGLGLPQDSVLALAWIDLAVAQVPGSRRPGWTEVRDAIAGKITREQRAEAQRLAIEWSEGVARD